MRIVARLSKPMACVVVGRWSETITCIVNAAFDAGGSSLESWPTVTAETFGACWLCLPLAGQRLGLTHAPVPDGPRLNGAIYYDPLRPHGLE
ncbi:hypothetical protein Rcae01_01200 [Novipirellula caenicola]|uniref:Uncharacterized protein n=1 Tax=Novipirellula caenicola TaxID=1536901 RepID=A0ABP9VKN2_9BACT